jgi:uncharacterized membrane protein YecN with MAPEG domain
VIPWSQSHNLKYQSSHHNCLSLITLVSCVCFHKMTHSQFLGTRVWHLWELGIILPRTRVLGEVSIVKEQCKWVEDSSHRETDSFYLFCFVVVVCLFWD